MSEQDSERIVRLETKMDSVKDSIDNLTRGIGKRVEEHGERISSIEKGMENLEQETENLWEKLNGHLDGHWKWVATTVSLIAMGTFFAQYFKS